MEFTWRQQILPGVWSCLRSKCFLGALLYPISFWAVFYFSSAMIVFFSNTAKHGNISVYLGGPGNFPFRFAKTTIWQAASWHDTACVNLCRFQATLFIVNLLNSLWEQTCSPLSNRHSCSEMQWPNRAHCALCMQSWDVKSGSGQHPQQKEEHTTDLGSSQHPGLVDPVKGRKELCFKFRFAVWTTKEWVKHGWWKEVKQLLSQKEKKKKEGEIESWV